jgi:broad specificity phosphatase PhoE
MGKRIGLALLVIAALGLGLLLPARADDAKTSPAHVLIIRHAEKPDDATSAELTAEGKERAEALDKLFKKSDDRPEPFPTPDFIFAAKDSNKSHRPTATAAPLAKKLGLTMNAEFPSDDPAKLADELFGNPKYAGKTVLISWRHGTIPTLAAKLKATEAPASWSDSVFDRVWQIDYDAKGKVTFRDLPQRLRKGDAEK